MQLLEEGKPSRANQKIFYEIRMGRLTRPKFCELCGREVYTVAHHSDYDNKLDVVWLCKPCHQKLDTPVHKTYSHCVPRRNLARKVRTGNKKGGKGMKTGDIVEIKNQTIGGVDIIEGKARLIKPIGNDGLNLGFEHWVVEFTDQKGEYFNRKVKAETRS